MVRQELSLCRGTQRREICLRHVLAFVFLSLPIQVIPAVAQTLHPDDITQERLKGADFSNVGSLRGQEHIDLSDGTLTLNATDVELPGNSSLEVRIKRSIDPMVIADSSHFRAGLGAWSLDIPRISSINSSEWINGTPEKYSRCSVNDFKIKPPAFYVQSGDGDSVQITYGDYWSPPRLITTSDAGALLIPNGNSLTRNQANAVKWVTKGRSLISCTATIKNGPGEGFVAQTPDGKRYRFDWIARNYHYPIVLDRMRPWITFERDEFSLYATRVEDQSGNWVEYDYLQVAHPRDGVKLAAIRANDGRRIDLKYDAEDKLTQVVANGRVWSYQYDSARSLVGVTLPDGTAHKYSIASLRGAPAGSAANCASDQHPMATGVRSIYTESPAGLRTSYYFEATRFGRSNVPRACSVGGAYHYAFNYAKYSLVKKVQEGPALPMRAWQYAYESKYGWAPYAGGKNTTRVSEPDGSYSVYTYGNTFEVDEGLLIKEEHLSSANLLLSSTVYSYGLPDGAVGIRVGTSPSALSNRPGVEWRSLTEFLDENLRPLRQRSITQDGQTFVRQIESVDWLGRPTAISKYHFAQ